MSELTYDHLTVDQKNHIRETLHDVMLEDCANDTKYLSDVLSDLIDDRMKIAECLDAITSDAGSLVDFLGFEPNPEPVTP